METAAEMQASLEQAIPVGTPLTAAEATLKSRGFAVTHQFSATSADREHWDYLYGVLSEQADPIVERKWQVEAYHRGSVVAGIDLQTTLTGPLGLSHRSKPAPACPAVGTARGFRAPLPGFQPNSRARMISGSCPHWSSIASRRASARATDG